MLYWHYVNTSDCKLFEQVSENLVYQTSWTLLVSEAFCIFFAEINIDIGLIHFEKILSQNPK